ncbi:transglutaminase family protein [Streptomyces tagetis]|uniref:Transglutaminase domain-containing protein n=1 Tax=Streptomyces tagetis TaxID=2820809 RepID=A0A940XMS4_9ACTN|nr:DUF3488 and transglutaminase-like domain-containing protein [Streptomyces sp. RG38]MBQ0829952.1 transglutaminase domain-containing protein [Streptomyces sp. RG38]
MSGQARVALCAWAATLMTACALLPLVDPATWIVQAGFLLAVQSGVGAVARRVPLARPLTVAAQAVTGVLLLTVAFARQEALAGLIPGPEAVGRVGALLRQGADDIARYAIPAPLESDGIRLMLVGGVLVIGLLVDTLAVTFRSAAPAGLPLLALYSVAAGLSEGGADWLWFLLAAAGYLTLLLAEGRDRLTRWGRVFGGPQRTAGEPAGPSAPMRTGRRIGAFALGIALVVPLALPALEGGLLDSARTAGNGGGGGGTISAVNPLVSLRDSLNVDEDREVLSLTTDAADVSDLYLRIVSLDDFDGTTWKPSKRHITSVPDGAFPTPVGLGPDVERRQTVTTVSAADWYAQDWLPMPYPPSAVRVAGHWRYEPVGMTLVGDHGQNTRGMTYEVRSLDVRPTAERLAAAPRPPEGLLREFTELPGSLPGVVAETAREVTAGASNAYERAVALQEFFATEGGFVYDTQVEVGSGSQAIARFLRTRRGFCVHFSFSMAAMARTLGIPARVAVGFAPGTPQGDGSVSVGLRDAHAWPELYFEGVGWTRFEPTPTRGSAPSYTLPEAPGSAVPDPAEPSRDARAEPSAAPSASDGCSAEDKKAEACASESAVAVPVAGDGGPGGYAVLGWTLAGLAVLLLPPAPMLWRLRTRSVRLGAHGRGAADAAPHALAVWQELGDTAWDLGIPPDGSLTPRGAAGRIVRLGRLDEEAAAAVHRVARAVEEALYAPRPRPVEGLARDADRAAAGLRASVGRGTRLRARIAPRSAVRVVWAVSARWAALRDRVRPALRPLRKVPGLRG